MRPKILTFVGYYLPGYKSGGPVRTVANMVDHLGDELDFRIVTADRDALDTESYPDVDIDEWNTVGKAQVFYASPRTQSLVNLVRLIRGTPHDVLYLNSFFSPGFTLRPLLARRLGLIPRRPVVLAPRGEFSEGAFALKRWKKQPYKTVARALGLYRDLTWQASSEYEAKDIREAAKWTANRISVAPDLPPGPRAVSGVGRPRRKGPGDSLRVCFVSRISPMKNLDYALRVLAQVQSSIEFTIVGPIRDNGYWQKCRSIIASMPENVKVEIRGSVQHAQVASVLADHDLFFLPTRGENYGHAIAEALAVGTPVLIADTTPWRGLGEAGVGWDLPLDDQQLFVDAIEKAAVVTEDDYARWTRRVANYARERLVDSRVVDANRQLLLDALAGGH
ncbi:MAG: glycosyltransferase family 4 protein [Thermoleophilia bacterium]